MLRRCRGFIAIIDTFDKNICTYDKNVVTLHENYVKNSFAYILIKETEE